MKKHLKTLLFIAGLGGINTFFWFYFDIGSLLTIDAIKHHREFLLSYVREHYALSALAYTAIYTIDAALFLPATSMLIMIGGLLFGISGTLAYATIGATLGGTIAFLVTRYALGQRMQAKYGHKLADFNKSVQANCIRYLLCVRIIPIFPFFLINVLAGLTLIPVTTFIWTTAIGIVPNIVLYAAVGKQLTSLNTFRDIVTPHFIAVCLTLTVLSIVPLLAHTKRA